MKQLPCEVQGHKEGMEIYKSWAQCIPFSHLIRLQSTLQFVSGLNRKQLSTHGGCSPRSKGLWELRVLSRALALQIGVRCSFAADLCQPRFISSQRDGLSIRAGV